MPDSSRPADPSDRTRTEPSDLKRFLRTASAIIDKRLTYAALTGAELSPR